MLMPQFITALALAKSDLFNNAYATQLKKKVDVFQEVTQTKKHIFLSLVSASGVKPNKHFDILIQGVVTLDDLFR